MNAAVGNLTVGAATGESDTGNLTLLAGNAVTVQNALTAGNLTVDGDECWRGTTFNSTLTTTVGNAAGSARRDGRST